MTLVPIVGCTASRRQWGSRGGNPPHPGTFSARSRCCPGSAGRGRYNTACRCRSVRRGPGRRARPRRVARPTRSRRSRRRPSRAAPGAGQGHGPRRAQDCRTAGHPSRDSFPAVVPRERDQSLGRVASSSGICAIVGANQSRRLVSRRTDESTRGEPATSGGCNLPPLRDPRVPLGPVQDHACNPCASPAARSAPRSPSAHTPPRVPIRIAGAGERITLPTAAPH